MNRYISFKGTNFRNIFNEHTCSSKNKQMNESTKDNTHNFILNKNLLYNIGEVREPT